MIANKILFFILFLFPLLIGAKEPSKDIKIKRNVILNVSQINIQDLLAVVDAQLKAIRSNEIEKAYNDYTSIEFRKTISLDDFKKIISEIKVLSNNKLFQFQSFYTEDDIATFSGELISVDGTSVQVEYDLVLENDQWKILGIQIYKTSVSSF